MAITAARMGLVSCPSCRLLSRAGSAEPAGCPRCGAHLEARKPDSLRRTTAYLAATVVLFVPANLLPVLTTRRLVRVQSDTILSGVVALWTAGSWPLAIVVFVASIVVPGLKVLALALLVATTRWRPSWRRRERTRLYRLLEAVGRWSMLDIFVMALLLALVRSPLAAVHVEPGAVAFAAVVILTMLASHSFDPRLIWDRGEKEP
jgi:paraquat-inducible protein A